MKSLIKLGAISLATSAFLVGCGSGGSDGPQTEIEDKEIIDTDPGTQATTITGKAVDGYLRFATVCLDLDDNGYCQIGQEPSGSTKEDGSYELIVTEEHQKHSNFSTSNLIVFGGQDSDTGKDFNGKLVSLFDKDNPNGVFITPLSTMVAAIKESDETLSKEDAKKKVAALLALTEEEVNADPVARAKAGDTKVLSRALELYKAVEVLASTSDLDKKAATENVYKALAEGVKDTDTSLSLGVVGILDNVDRDSLDANAQQVIDAAIVLAKNVELAVEQMEADVDQGKAIAAVANTVDNVKKLIVEEIEDFDFAGSSTFTTEVAEDAVASEEIKITAAKVDRVIVVNVVKNDIGEDVVLTDAQLDAILQEDLGDRITLEAISDAISIADDASLEELKAQIEKQVTEKETEEALKNAYDASITAKDVLLDSGAFDIYWNSNAEPVPGMVKVVDGKFVHYDYNATSDAFELSYTFGPEESEHKYIELVGGTWSVKTESEKYGDERISFDEYGNLIVKSSHDNAKYSVSAFDASGLRIGDIYDNHYGGSDFNSDKTFSDGARYYEVYCTELPEESAGFEPRYELWHYQDGYWDESLEKWVYSEGNENYERYWEQVNYTSFEEFKSVNSIDGTAINYHYYDYSAQEGSRKSGYLKFVDETNVKLIGYDNTEEGTYAVETVDGTDVMLFTFADEQDNVCKRGYAVISGALTTVHICGNQIDTGALEQYSKEFVITSIDEFVQRNTKNNEYGYGSSLYFWTDLEEYEGYFAENGVLEFYKHDQTKSDLVGSYEIKTVGSSEILVIKPPLELQEEYMKNRAYTIYAVQDGALRRGEYAYAAEQYEESDDVHVFVNYNETAVRDMHAALKESAQNEGIDGTTATNSNLASAFKARGSEKIDTVKLRKMQKALRDREASLKAYRGF